VLVKGMVIGQGARGEWEKKDGGRRLRINNERGDGEVGGGEMYLKEGLGKG